MTETYSPNNLNVYTSAFAGALGGMLGFGKVPANPESEVYAVACAVAGALAQAVDTLWTGNPDWLETQILQSICEAEFSGKNVPSSAPPPSAFAAAAQAILAILSESESYYEGQGIAPPALPEGGEVAVTLTGDVVGTGPADSVTTQAIQLQNFAGPFSPPENGSWTQTQWYVDPSNASGHASNANSGLTDTTPLLTWQELGRRLGTTRPSIHVDVSITAMSSITTYDPFSLVNLGQGVVTLSGSQSTGQTSSGVIAGFTAKNQAAGILASFTALSGMAAGQTVRNTTRNSYATIYKLAGGVATLSQAMNFTTLFFPTVDDTWADGDAIVSFVPVTAYLQEIGSLGQTFFPEYTTISDITSLNNFPAPPTYVLPGAIFVRCVFAGEVGVIYESSRPNLSNAFLGCLNQNSLVGGQPYVGDLSPTFFLGGICNSCYCALTFGNNAILSASAGVNSFIGGGQIYGSFPGLYLDAGVNAFVNGIFYVSNGPIWGPAGSDLICQSGTLLYLSSQSASSTFLFGGRLLIGEASGTAYSLSTAAGVVTIHGGIALTPANLDAAAGATGFGGTATNLAGASITNGAQT